MYINTSQALAYLTLIITLLTGCGASEQTRVTSASRTIKVNFGHDGPSRLIMGKRRFIVGHRKSKDDKVKAVAYSPKGALVWERTLPCTGLVYQGNDSHFVCRDYPSNTLIGVKTSNGEVSWRTPIKGEIDWMDSYHDDLIVQLKNRKTSLISTTTGKRVHKVKPLPKDAKVLSIRMGDYLVSEPALGHALKTNFLVTRRFKGRKHIRTDYGINKPQMHHSIKEGLIGYGHLKNGWALGLIEPRYHKLLWANAWPHKVEPRSIFVRSEAGVVVWKSSGHWAAYSVKDGTYLGGGTTKKIEEIVAGYGAVAKLKTTLWENRILTIKPLKVSKKEQRRVKALVKQAPEPWLFGRGSVALMTAHQRGLDLSTGFHEDTDLNRYFLRLKRSSEGIKVSWKRPTDRGAQRGDYLIRKSAYEGRGEVNMRLHRLHQGSIERDESAFIMPKEVFKRAVKDGVTTWRVQGASRKLKYLGEAWHSMKHIIKEDHPVRYQVYTAHLFTSGKSHYKVVLSEDLPVIVSWRSPRYRTTIMGTDQTREAR